VTSSVHARCASHWPASSGNFRNRRNRPYRSIGLSLSLSLSVFLSVFLPLSLSLTLSLSLFLSFSPSACCARLSVKRRKRQRQRQRRRQRRRRRRRRRRPGQQRAHPLPAKSPRAHRTDTTRTGKPAGKREVTVPGRCTRVKILRSVWRRSSRRGGRN